MQTNRQPTEYQTGSTTPPKSHGGAVAFLLSAVIFVCGISTILSLMRINLLRSLDRQAETRQCQVSFSSTEADNQSPEPANPGFQGQDLPQFWQDYRSLPEGIYITEADKDLGLHPGDILLSVNDQSVTDWETLLAILAEYAPGDKINITVFRDGTEHQLFIIWR